MDGGPAVTNPRERVALEARVRDAEARAAELEAQLFGDFYALDDHTFQAATGFATSGEAKWDAEKSGALDLLRSTGRHAVPLRADLIEPVAGLLAGEFPGLQGIIEEARDDLLRVAQEGAGSVRQSALTDWHWFLIPFLYVYGGVEEWMAPLLPGIRVSASHFSRLLDIGVPIVAEKWAHGYFQERGVDWLRANCAAPKDYHVSCDIVLLYDGSKFPLEHSSGMREQRSTYSSVVNDNILQLIAVTNMRGWFVEATRATGGRAKETEMAMALPMWERLNSELKERFEDLRVHLIVDRGFRDNIHHFEEAQSLGSWQFGNLVVTAESPHFLHTKDAPQRSQHPAAEALENRLVQGRRWMNEKVFAFLKDARFFQRTIKASTLHIVDELLCIACGIANKKMGVQACWSSTNNG